MVVDSSDSDKKGVDAVSVRENARDNFCVCPALEGLVAYEWDLVAGTSWFSPEFRNVTQHDDYDWMRPNNEEWWAKHLLPEDLSVVQRTCLALLGGYADKAEATYRLLRDDGTPRRIFSRAHISKRAADGSPLLVAGIWLDITDSCIEPGSTLGVSSVSDLDYHSMLENSPDTFVRLTRDVKPVYVNPAAMRYIGNMPDTELLSDTVAALDFGGDFKEVIFRNVQRVFQEKTVAREALFFTMPDGREIYGECSFWPEYDGEGNVTHAMVQFRDLTEKRRMEQRQEAQYKLTLMENDTEEDVLRFVMDSVLTFTDSRSGFIFFPNEPDSDKGYLYWSGDHYKSLDRNLLPTDRLPHDLSIQLRDERGNRRYRSINNGDGKTPLYVVFDNNMAIMRGITAPVMEEGRVVCIAGVCNKNRDYLESELQQLEIFINSAWLLLRRRRFVRELQEAKEAAEAANRAKNAFLANISHELRTPLNGVLSMLQLIAALPMSDEQREYLSTAQWSGNALMRIIADLLDFSCMESGKMPLATELFDCRQALRSALHVLQQEARKKGLRFDCRIDPKLPRYLWGDGHRLRQIVYNIVGNALKYTSRGYIRVVCGCVESNRPDKVGLFLKVCDSGIGIPSDMLASIFDAFTQIGSVNRSKYPGTGLGLSIVKHLVGMMDGTIFVESQPDKGTTFHCTMFFGLAEADAEALDGTPDGPGSPAKRGQSSGPLDILVAEDDEVCRFAIRTFLQKEGHRVVCVADGRGALEALQLQAFHCLFTDIAMPYVDGLELVRRIRSGNAEGYPPSEQTAMLVRDVFPQNSGVRIPLQSDISIVAVTAHTMIGDRERFLGEGINHYVSKPIIKKELDEAVRFVARRLGKL